MSVVKRYQCSLCQKDLEKAVEELNEPENNDERLQRIDELKKDFNSQDHGLKLLSVDDGFLLRFLRARKFDQQRSLNMLINYHKQRESWPEVFDKVRNPHMVRFVFEGGCFVAINGKATDGSTVCIGRPGKIDKAVMMDFIATVVLSLEQLLVDETVQIYGVTIIQDMSYIGLDLMQQMGPSVARKYLSLLQDAMPMRLKSVNIVNEPTFFDIVFAIIRPFMKEKMKKRFQIHGSTYGSLYQIIEAANLPSLYGGTGADLDREADNWKNLVFASFGEDTYL